MLEGRRQKAGGRRQKAEGRRQKAEGRRQKGKILHSGLGVDRRKDKNPRQRENS